MLVNAIEGIRSFSIFFIIHFLSLLANEDYQRDMKVFLNSKRNAGVYMDTTVESSDPIVVTRNNKDAVYAALRQPDLYEQESDEEF